MTRRPTRKTVLVAITWGLVAVMLLGVAYSVSWLFLASYDKMRPHLLTHVDDLGVAFCPDEVILLDVYPAGALGDQLLYELLSELRKRGCTATISTPEALAKHENPDKTQWMQNRYLGARLANIRIRGSLLSDSPRPWHTALQIGWLKGGLHGRGKIDYLYWNGLRWVKKGEAVYRN